MNRIIQIIGCRLTSNDLPSGTIPFCKKIGRSSGNATQLEGCELEESKFKREDLPYCPFCGGATTIEQSAKFNEVVNVWYVGDNYTVSVVKPESNVDKLYVGRIIYTKDIDRDVTVNWLQLYETDNSKNYRVENYAVRDTLENLELYNAETFGIYSIVIR